MKKISYSNPEGLWRGWSDVLNNLLPSIKNLYKKETEYLRKNIKKGSKVLDVGCGGGRNIKDVLFIVNEVVGIDNYKLAVKEAKKKLVDQKKVKILLKEARKTSFKNNYFDYVICMGNTFGNFGEDKLRILKEMKRVVKKNGKIIISVYSENALPIRLKQYKKAGVIFKKIGRDGTIITGGDAITEQFSAQKLKNFFDKTKLKLKIIKLNKIGYICEGFK